MKSVLNTITLTQEVYWTTATYSIMEKMWKSEPIAQQMSFARWVRQNFDRLSQLGYVSLTPMRGKVGRPTLTAAQRQSSIISTQLPDDTYTLMREYCHINNITYKQFIRNAITAYLQNNKINIDNTLTQ